MIPQKLNKTSEIEYNTLLKFIDDNELNIFSTQSLKNHSDLSLKSLQQVLELLVKKQFIIRLEKGKFVRHSFKNEYTIGSYLTDDAVIAYWSALNIHGLTEQFPNKIFVQTTKNKKNKEILGVQYHFIKVKLKKLTGFEKWGVGANQFRITDVEKTIIDCFDQVKYSGGFMELIRAFRRTKLDVKKLIDYSIAIDNSAVMKRIGYLAELFNKRGFSEFIKFAKKNKSKNYDLFDIFGCKEGKYIPDWNLILNIEEQDIMDIAKSIY